MHIRMRRLKSRRASVLNGPKQARNNMLALPKDQLCNFQRLKCPKTCGLALTKL